MIAARIALVAAIALAVSTPATVRAADPAADAFVRKGTSLLERRDYAGALQEFHKAHELTATPPIVARIGLAEQGMGRYVQAELHLQEALASGSDPWIRQLRAVLEKALTDVRARLGTVTLTGSPGAIVKIDDEVKGLLPLPLPLRIIAGERRVEVSADGFKPFHRKLVVRGGQPHSVVATLEPEPVSLSSSDGEEGAAKLRLPTAAPTAHAISAAAPPVVPIGALAPGWWRPVGWVLLATGVAAGAGGVYLLTRRQKVDDAQVLPEDKGKSYLDVGQLALGAAGLAGGAGLAAIGTAMVLVERGTGQGETLALSLTARF